MGVLRGAFFIVGGTIGAGFITGAELVRFFGCKNFLVPLLCSCFFFFLLCLLYLRIGKKFGGYSGFLSRLGRAAHLVRLIFLLCAFVSSAGMLAGLDALCPTISPLLSVGGLAVSCYFLGKGMEGVSKLNSVLVPLLLCLVFFYARGGIVFSDTGKETPRFGWLLYAGMNAFLMAPVLTDAGKEMTRPVLSASFAGGLIAVAAVCILGGVCREGANAVRAEMPFLQVAKGKFFAVAVGLAILTSLVSSLYVPFSACDKFHGKKKTAAKAGTLFAAFCLSRIGLKGIVGMFYPLIGGAGLFVSALCILYDQLFEKHHKKVHSRSQHAEDTGRAHHKVELEHLPAVDDQISESRP